MPNENRERDFSLESGDIESLLNLDSEPITSSRFTDEAFQQRLVNTDAPSYPEQWLRLLDDSSWKVRVQAVQALRRSTETRVIEALIRCLSDETAAVRIAAIEVLAALGELIPMKELIACLQDEEPIVRITTIQVLGALGKRVSVEYLLPTLADLDWTVRETAVLTLGKRVPDKVYPALYDEESFVREAALFVLKGRLPIKQLISDLKYGNLKVRVGLASIMGELKELAAWPELLKALIYVLQHDDEGSVRKEAILSLGRLDISVPIEPLRAALSDSDQDVRDAAEIVLDAKEIELAPETEIPDDIQADNGGYKIGTGSTRNVTDHMGQQFGNYTLINVIGESSRATVYLGQHIYLKTPVAIKVLKAHLPEHDRQGFLHEAQTVAKLNHPAIVRVFDFEVENQNPFLVMDYAPQGNLRQLYPRNVRIPLSTLVPIAKQIAGALQYAHDNAVIHRDVKPENILLSSDNAPLLADFGIAQLERNPANPYQYRNEVSGTRPYMAPEQWQGRPCAASDQYSLAIMVYEWLCGEPPFQGSKLNEIMNEHLNEPPPSLQQRVPTLSQEVEAVVVKALSKNPERRYSSVQAFANALAQAASPVSPMPSSSSSFLEWIRRLWLRMTRGI